MSHLTLSKPESNRCQTAPDHSFYARQLLAYKVNQERLIAKMAEQEEALLDWRALAERSEHEIKELRSQLNRREEEINLLHEKEQHRRAWLQDMFKAEPRGLHLRKSRECKRRKRALRRDLKLLRSQMHRCSDTIGQMARELGYTMKRMDGLERRIGVESQTVWTLTDTTDLDT